MMVVSIIILVFYSVLILMFVKGFDQIELFKPELKNPVINFSILIPFRNEAKNLSSLLESIALLQYPNNKFEILMINDDSTDESKTVINDFKRLHNNIELRLFENKRKSNSPKKDAIEIGITNAQFDWIITTDADCIIPKNWLFSFDGFIQKEVPKMVVAPISYKIKNRFLDKFQNLDILSLQGSTIGGFGIKKPFLCNGANLCYNKDAFIKVNGFEGNNNITSGDDIFLLEKMVQNYPDKVKYLKSQKAIIITKPEKNLRNLIHQRIRWASKTSNYSNIFGKLIGITVFTTNALLVLLLFLATFNKISWQHFGLFFLIKFNVDFILLYKTAVFFKQQDSLKVYLFSSILYPFFIVFIALTSVFKGYTWKDRKFSK